MLDYILNFFSKSNSKKGMREAIIRDAIIVDVRSGMDFATGHNKNAINIPIEKFIERTMELKKREKPVIVCCSNGIKSARAVTILKAMGVEVYNAGNWKNLTKI
jgi:rhodanese-related sulfurtransferase